MKSVGAYRKLLKDAVTSTRYSSNKAFLLLLLIYCTYCDAEDLIFWIFCQMEYSVTTEQLPHNMGHCGGSWGIYVALKRQHAPLCARMHAQLAENSPRCFLSLATNFSTQASDACMEWRRQKRLRRKWRRERKRLREPNERWRGRKVK